jgi:trans-aconitate 2-methyltransferase
MTADPWTPAQYNRFRAQRAQPFADLLALVRVRPGMRVIDLGCGTGELTARLAEALPDSDVEGLDNSPAMLAEAPAGLRTRCADMQAVADFGPYDLVFSNAALQWADDHDAFLERLLGELGPGAQVAVQVPSNHDHVTHRLASELGLEQLGFARRSPVWPIERYADALFRHGFQEQVVLERVYGHALDSVDDAVEWVKGTLLGAYLKHLDSAGAAAFEAEYRTRLHALLGDPRPYFYPFKRTLFWGERA